MNEQEIKNTKDKIKNKDFNVNVVAFSFNLC